MILSLIISVPNYLGAQAKSLSDYKIITKFLSLKESASFNSVRKSPSDAYRLEREKNGFSIIDNNTGFKHIPNSPGKIRFSGWSKNEDHFLFSISFIPVGNGKFTGGVGVYFFNDKSTKIFRPEKYFLMNSRLSPDGKMIVATGSTKKKGYIIVIDIESGKLTELTDVVSYRPAWSPNSDKVYYVETLDRRNAAIISVDLKSGDKIEIIKRPSYIDFAVSPDGKYIAFTSPKGGTGIRELNMINSDGTNLVNISSIGSWANFFPRWSPDGRFIEYQYPLTKNHYGKAMSSDIYIYVLSTNLKINLTTEASGLYNFRGWKKDNSLIIRYDKDEKSIYRSYKLEE